MFFLQFTLYQFDPLWQSMYQPAPVESQWVQEVSTEPEDQSYSELSNNSEAEHYSWELGTPDNIPETEIIY